MLKAGESSPRTSAHLVRSQIPDPRRSGPPALARGDDPELAPSAAASYFQAALQLIAERAHAETGATGAAVALGDSTLMVCRASIGTAPDVGVHLRPDAGLSGECLRTGAVVVCADTQTDPRVNAVAARNLDLRSVVIMPVFAAGKLAGVLQVMSPRPRAFGSREVNGLQQIAEALGATIEKQQRFQQFLVTPQLLQSAEENVADQPKPAATPAQPPVTAAPAIAAESTAAATPVFPAAIPEEPRTRFSWRQPGVLRIGVPVLVLLSLLGTGWYVSHRSANWPRLAKATPTDAAASAPPAASEVPKPPALRTDAADLAPTAAATPATSAAANAELSRLPKPSTGLTTRALVNRVKQMKVEDIAPLEHRAKAGDPEAQVRLGLAYGEGTLLIHDPAQAVTWYRKAAEQGYGPAEEALGVAYQTGNGVPKDAAKAVQWYTRAAQHGSLLAANELGMMYSSGAGVERSYAEAWKWYSIAAERGDASAQYNLARMYHLGQGVRANPGLEFQWLTKAARQGLATAQFSLALMYQEGVGVKPDPAEAARLLRKAADQGDRLAQMQLGYAFGKGLGVPVDYEQSLKWYRMAAEQGEPKAAYALSVRYFNGGQGVTQSYTEAGKWTKVAAENGHPDAQYNLGVMYEQGVGIPVNMAEAAKWYRRAADQGVGSAQFRLGLMYASGKGVSKDVTAAYKWLSLGQNEARESGDPLTALQKEMTPEQIREAERGIKQWQSAHPGHQR